MKVSKIQDINNYQIHGWMLNRMELKGIALHVYAIIFSYSQDGESEFFGNLQYLQDFTGASKPTVIKALKELLDRGYITKRETMYKGKQQNRYQVNLEEVKKRYLTSKETLPNNGKETLPQNGQETLPNNKRIDNKGFDNKGDTKTPTPLPETDNLFGSELQAAFDDWLRYKTERKDSYTPTGLQNLISEIRNNAAKHGEAAVAALIRKCIASGWKGIIFEKLEEQPRRGGRKEIVPDWASQQGQSEMAGYVKQLRKRTAGEDPEVAARAKALRERLTK